MFSFPFFKKIIFLFLILIPFQHIFAQTKTKATVSPFIIEEKVSPGQNFEREIILTNDSDEKLNFSVFVKDIKLDEKGNLFLLPPKSEKFSLFDWVNLEEKEIELLPGKSKKIKIFFKIPEKEAVGSRPGAIIFSSKKDLSQQEAEGFFAALSHQIGVLVFLSSVQEVREEAKILKFETQKKYYFTPFLVKFKIEIQNLGNVYIEPYGKTEIKDFKGKNVGEIIFNQSRLKILPETKRIFEQTWQGTFGLGKYTAKLYLFFGTPQKEGGSGIKTIFAQISFWIFPLREIFFGVLILIIIIFFFTFLIKRYKKINKLFS